MTELTTRFPDRAEFINMREIVKPLLQSGFLPITINNEAKAIAIALKARELNIPPMMAYSEIHIINGKPALSATLMLTLIYRAFPNAKIVYETCSINACVIKAARPGQEPSLFKFTMEDAERAGIANNQSWKKYPEALLRARCISAMARAVFPDALMGCVYTPEEMGAEVDSDENVIMLEVEKIPNEITREENKNSDNQRSIRNGGDGKPLTSKAPRQEVSLTDPGDYTVKFGKFHSRRIKDIYKAYLAAESVEESRDNDLENYVNYIYDEAAKNKKEIKGDVLEFVKHAESFLENELKDNE